MTNEEYLKKMISLTTRISRLEPRDPDEMAQIDIALRDMLRIHSGWLAARDRRHSILLFSTLVLFCLLTILFLVISHYLDIVVKINYLLSCWLLVVGIAIGINLDRKS